MWDPMAQIAIKMKLTNAISKENLILSGAVLIIIGAVLGIIPVILHYKGYK